jgi:hypothetical protein
MRMCQVDALAHWWAVTNSQYQGCGQAHPPYVRELL